MNAPTQEPGWQPHPVEWNDERVARFWNHLAREQGDTNQYFAEMAGPAVVKLTRRFTPLAGRVLDYGCGPGHLAARLVAQGVRCEGVDFSPDSVARANERLGKNPCWNGAVAITSSRVAHADATFDTIFCLETIEHVLPHHLDAMFAELHRLLKPGGHLILTTPHDERLAEHSVCCPECGCTFHHVQHVRSHTRASLTAFMEQHRFRTIAAEATDLLRFQLPLWPGLPDLTPRRLARIAWSAVARTADALHIPSRSPAGHWAAQYFGAGPNLYWIGTRAT